MKKKMTTMTKPTTSKNREVTVTFEIHEVHPGSQVIVTGLETEPSVVFVRFTKPPKWMKDEKLIARSRINLGSDHQDWLTVGQKYEVRALKLLPV